MTDHKRKADFITISVSELKNIYIKRGFQREDTWNLACENRLCSLPLDPNFEHDASASDEAQCIFPEEC